MSIRKGSSIIAGNIGQNVDSTLSPTSDNPVKNSVIYDALRNTLSTDDITNCITEIPQDIKLELNNGTLTLKAGSKVYVPNGSGVFDEVVIANDISSNSFAGSIARFVFIDINNNTINAASSVFSGQTSPTLSEVGFWYDTVNNIIRRTIDGGATWTTGYSFPIAIVTSVNDVATSINQTFNGFGYIGSTVFALPGVKGLIPNGRNADGTLKNIEITISAVQTHQLLGTRYNGLVLKTTGINIECAPLSNSIQWGYSYDHTNNLVKQYQSGSLITRQCAIIGSLENNNLTITSLTPKTVFHAVDYSDTEYIAHQAMPSNRYTDLTVGASGSTYTAPADGYFVLRATTTAAGNYLEIMNSTNGFDSLIQSGGSNIDMSVFMPVSKGQTIIIYYSTNTPVLFRFIYAKGAV